ncbi:hypothetical protein IPJ72_02445 [Candidatus Peregrinibacteria bacterium]|nr:MAG: hypothetical protein IPJ72_02445 [Candidatus Peregrinibacteria bacterium]
MKKLLFSTATIGVLLFAGCTAPQTEKTDAQEAMSNPMETACKDSGGTWADSTCECPSGTETDGSPTYTYQKETGNCVDPFGLPGGKLGEEIKAGQPLAQ